MRNTVIYIGSYFLPDKSAGAQRALSLSKTFRELSYNVILVGMEENQDYGTNILDTRSECEGFESYSVPKPLTIKNWIHHSVSISEYEQLMKKIGTDKILAVVVMEYEAIPLWKLKRFCDKYGIALIADAEEWYEHSHLPFPMNIGKDFDTFLRMHFVYPFNIDYMICISRFFENYYKSKMKEIVYIPGTIDKNQSKWDNLDYYQPNEVFTIGYAGHPGMHFEKERLDILVNAIVQLNEEGYNCILKIAGIDKDFLRQRMGNLVDNDNIVCLGKISHTDCLKFITSCDFSAIVREDKRVTKAGFPTKFSESFGCGTPVNTTNTSNLIEYIQDGVTGYLCAECDAKTLKETILNAWKMNKECLIEMHVNLRKRNPLVYSAFNENLSVFMDKVGGK